MAGEYYMPAKCHTRICFSRRSGPTPYGRGMARAGRQCGHIAQRVFPQGMSKKGDRQHLCNRAGATSATPVSPTTKTSYTDHCKIPTIKDLRDR